MTCGKTADLHYRQPATWYGQAIYDIFWSPWHMFEEFCTSQFIYSQLCFVCNKYCWEIITLNSVALRQAYRWRSKISLPLWLIPRWWDAQNVIVSVDGRTRKRCRNLSPTFRLTFFIGSHDTEALSFSSTNGNSLAARQTRWCHDEDVSANNERWSPAVRTTLPLAICPCLHICFAASAQLASQHTHNMGCRRNTSRKK